MHPLSDAPPGNPNTAYIYEYDQHALPDFMFHMPVTQSDMWTEGNRGETQLVILWSSVSVLCMS